MLQDPEHIQALGAITAQGTFVSDAPLVIVIVMDNATRPQLDAGRALQQMELVAWSEGLGTCFVGVREAEQQVRVKELLGIPAGMELIVVLPFGYRPDDFTGRGVPRKPLAEMAHREMFGQSYVTTS